MPNLEDLVARIRLDTSGLQAGLASAGSTLSSAGDKMKSAGSTMTKSLTLPLLGVAAAGVTLAAKFDTTMRQVAIATGGPSKALSELAMKMGAETAFSAGEAADAMLELAKGGMTAVQIKGGALAATMKLASAGGVDLASASTYVSNAMAAFGLKARDANAVTVALAGAANASSASVESLGMGLAQASLASKNAGLSLQETTGVLSMFDAAGLKGSDAGTSLKSMLSSLTPATDKARSAMANLGLDFVKADGSFVSIANVATQLKNKLGPLSEAQRAQRMETIFGSDGVRAASILMDGGAKAVTRYTQASRDSATTNKLANASMQGMTGAIEKAKGSLETAAITIGQTLAPVIVKVSGFIEDLANKFTDLPGGMKTTIVVVAAIAAALGPLLMILGSIATGAGVLATAFAAVSLPMIAAAAGVAVLGAALVLLWQRSEAFRSAVTGAFQAVKAAVGDGIGQIVTVIRGQLLPSFQAIIPIIAPVAAFIIKIIGGAVVGAIKGAVQVIVGVVNIISGVFKLLKAVVTGDWGAAWAAVKQIAQGVWDAIVGAFKVWMNVGILAVFKQGLKFLLTAWKTAWTTVKVNGMALWLVIKSALVGVWNAIRGSAVGVFNGIKSLIVGVWNAVKASTSAVWNAIRGVVSGSVNGIKSLVSSTFNAVKGVITSVWNAVRGATVAAWQGIKGAVANGIANMLGLVRSIPGKIKGALSGAASWLVSTGVNVVQGLINGLRSMAGAVTSALVGLLPGPLQKFAGKLGIQSPSTVFEQFGKYVGQGFIKGVTGTKQAVVEAFGSVVEDLRKRSETSLANLVAGTRKHLMALGAEYGQVTSTLRGKVDELKAMMEEAAQYRQGVQDSFNAGADITGFTGGTDEEGNALPLQFRDIIAGLQTARDKTAAFQTVLAQLQRQGLNQAAIDQIVQAGPEAGLTAAQAILEQGEAAVTRINRLQAAIRDNAKAIAEIASDSMFKAGVQTMEGIIAGLRSRESELDDQMARIARKMQAVMRRELGIRSPSTVMAGLGVNTAEGFALGLRSMETAVAKAAKGMVGAALVDAPDLTRRANVGATRGVRSVTPVQPTPQVRVYVGDRELTDIVRTEVTGTFTPLRQMTRQGAY